MALASLVVRLVADASDFERGLGKAENSTSGFVNRIGKDLRSVGKVAAGAGALIGGAALGAVIKFGPQAVSAASDIQESMGKVNTVFEDSAGLVDNFARQSATSFGIAREDALEAAGTFGNLFRTIGLTSEVSAGMSTDLVALAADLGAFNNMDPTQVLEKLRSGLVGEVEPLRQLGINLTAAQTEAKAMEMGLADADGTITQAAKTQARYALILEQSALAQGTFAKESEGLAAQQKILGAVWRDTLAEVGGVALPLITKGLSGFLGILQGSVIPVVQRVIAGIRTFQHGVEAGVDPITALGVVLESFLPEDVVEKITGGLTMMIEGIQQVWAFVQPIVAAIAAWIGKNVELQDVLVVLGAALASVIVPALAAIIAPVAAVLFAFGKLVAIVAAVRTAWETNFLGIRDITMGIFEAIKSLFTFFIEQFITSLEAFLLMIEGDWEGAWEKIKEGLSNSWDAIKNVVSDGVDAVKSFFTDTDWAAVGDNVISAIGNGIRNGIGALKDAARAAAEAALSAAKDFLGINSDSKKFIGVGENSAGGFATGMQRGMSAVENAARNMATGAVSGARQGGTSVSVDSPVTLYVSPSSNLDMEELAYRVSEIIGRRVAAYAG